MTSGEVLRRATEHLARTSDTSRLDAELLLAHTLGSSRIELYTDSTGRSTRPSSTPIAVSSRAARSTSRSPTCSASGASAG